MTPKYQPTVQSLIIYISLTCLKRTPVYSGQKYKLFALDRFHCTYILGESGGTYLSTSAYLYLLRPTFPQIYLHLPTSTYICLHLPVYVTQCTKFFIYLTKVLSCSHDVLVIKHLFRPEFSPYTHINQNSKFKHSFIPTVINENLFTFEAESGEWKFRCGILTQTHNNVL